MDALPMNTNWKLFHGGPACGLEQILRSKQPGQGRLWGDIGITTGAMTAIMRASHTLKTLA